MKKAFYLVSSVALILSCAFLLFACSGSQQASSTTAQEPPSISVSFVVDGVAADSFDLENYVAYVAPSDDSRSFGWSYTDKTVINADPALTYTVHIFSVKAAFDCADELEASSGFSVGDRIGTRSFHKDTHRGAAIYSVTDKKPSHIAFLEFSDGLYAELCPFEIGGERRITVDQLGAYGDGEKNDAGKFNFAFEYPNADVVELESDVYLQERTIYLDRGNIRVNGKGASIYNRYDRVITGTDFSIRGKSDDERLENIIIENLTLVCSEQDGSGALYDNAGHCQFGSAYTKDLTVRGCRFIAPFYEDLPTRQIGSVSIRCSVNTVFENNYIQNLCGAPSHSGGLWFWSNEKDLSEVSRNIIVRNNYIEKTGHDETLAFFMGAFEDITVENNVIYTHSEPVGDTSAHVIGFGVWDCPTSVKNVVFSGNKVDGIASRDLMMFSHVENIKVFDNELTLRCNTAADPVANAVFRVTYIEENYTAAGIANVQQKDVHIYGNIIKVYNTFEIPIADPSCNEGFTFGENELEYIPVR